MFLGAMVMGPLGGYLIKRFDQMISGRMRTGFEMLINNFSVGILGMLCAIAGFMVIGPVMLGVTQLLNAGVGFVLEKGVLPLMALFIEPGKILFLNNAINHGILTPLGIEQASDSGKSILFLLETNPGPGLGVLLAYSLFGKGDAKKTAPASSVILFLGGIHEIYFPYILMRPILIVATILGSASAMAYYQLMSSGLVSAASPGSIISLVAMSPRGTTFHVVVGVLLATIVSFLIACFFVKGAVKKTLAEAKVEKDLLKKKVQNPKKIVFACQAGMGSSAMGAAAFRKMVDRSDLFIANTAVSAIPSDTDIVVCQAIFEQEARRKVPSAEIVVIDTFLSDPALDALASRLSGKIPVLKPEMVQVGVKDNSKEEAIRRIGELLVHGGYVNSGYIDGMFERESMTSTYIGMGIAVPHGTQESRKHVLHTGIVVVQYPEGIDFGEEKAYLIVGIAGTDDTHLDILSALSTVLAEEEILAKMKITNDPAFIYEKLIDIK
jgi:PTS system mannitol-specific IIC component